jgi:hypothetical protein
MIIRLPTQRGGEECVSSAFEYCIASCDRGLCPPDPPRQQRFREYLDSVDGIFWRRAIARAYSWWWFKRPASRILYLWKKGTYGDPVASFLDVHHRNGPPFVKHVPHLLEMCLPGGFLVRSPPSSSPMDKTKTLYGIQGSLLGFSLAKPCRNGSRRLQRNIVF